MIATHTACIWGMPSGLDQFAHHGLLGPDIVHVHCNACTERDWTLLQRSDAKISVTPETEMQMGMGHPPIRRAIERGLVLSLSCDVVSSNSGDMFSQMRLGLQDARALENDRSHRRRSDPTELAFSTRDALTWATVNGARALGTEDRIGSLTPGKQADVIVVGPGDDRLNMLGLAEPVGVGGAAGEPLQRRRRCSSPDAPSSSTAGCSTSTSRACATCSTAHARPCSSARSPTARCCRRSSRRFDDLAPALLPNLNVPAPGA